MREVTRSENSKRFETSKTRIPKFRAVPVSSEKKPSDRYVRTKSQIEQAPLSQQKQRRKWQSFDLGHQPVRSDTFIIDNEAEKVPREESREPSSSDSWFDHLREDLANEGTKESHLKMAQDLLEDVGGLDSMEEVKYREEQAMFWLMKATERGSEEALSQMRVMYEQGRGSNVREVSCFLSLNQEELIGQRVGRQVFHALSHGRGFVPICLIENVAKGRHIEESQDIKDSEVILATRKTEKLHLSDLIESGISYAQNELPTVDQQLMEYELRALPYTSLIKIILRLIVFINTLISVGTTFMGSYYFQTLCAMITYHFIVNYQSILQSRIPLTVNQIVVPAFVILINFRKICEQMFRLKRWKNVFATKITVEEEKMLHNSAKSNSKLEENLQYLALVLLQAPGNFPNAIAISVMLLRFGCSSMVLLATSSVLIIANANLVTFYVVKTFGISIHASYVMDHQESISAVLIGSMVLMFLLKRKIHSFAQFVSICTIMTHSLTIYEVEIFSKICTVTLLTVYIFKLIIFNHAAWMKRKFIFLMILSLLTLPRLEAKSITEISFEDLRKVCPRDEASPMIQFKCNHNLVNLPIEWQGTVQEIEYYSVDLNFFKWVKMILLEKDENCDVSNEEEKYICNLKQQIPRYQRARSSASGCKLSVEMKKTSNLMFRNGELIFVMAENNARNCTKFDKGSYLHFHGEILNIYQSIIVKANYIF